MENLEHEDGLLGHHSSRRQRPASKGHLNLTCVTMSLLMLAVGFFSVWTYLMTRDIRSDIKFLRAFVTNPDSIGNVGDLKRNTSKAVFAAMDQTADPCQDFYQYSCGGWLQSTAIPDDKSQLYLVIDDIQEMNTQVLRDILQDQLDWPMINLFYRTCMNTSQIDQLGASPLTGLFGAILGLSQNASNADIMKVIATLHAASVPALFQFSDGADLLLPLSDIGQLNQGGWALPDIGSYDDANLTSMYSAHITSMLKLAGQDSASGSVADIVAFEKSLAGVSWTVDQLRNINATYNINNLASLQKLSPGLDWKTYFDAVGVTKTSDINVQVPSFITGMGQLLSKTSMSTLKAYLTWQTVHYTASLLDASIRKENFAFFGTVLTGAAQQPTREKQCVSQTDNMLGMILGRYYIQKMFTKQGKELVSEMMDGLLAAMKARLQTIDWMDDTTRANALKKLSQFRQQMGYPDVWKEYNGLALDGGYFDQALAIREFEFKTAMQSIGGPVNRNSWDMTPPTVNAYYEPTDNTVTVPAGILQGFYFNPDFAPAILFGGTGVTLGHEMTHGFDDQGSQFDGTGKFTNWWSPSTLANWKERTQCVSEFYSKYTIPGVPGLHLNGNLTNGENIADIGGVRQSWAAYKNYMHKYNVTDEPYVDGMTNDQLFFVSYAQGWCVQTRPSLAKSLQKTNPHAPGKCRVNGPVSQFPTFAEVFNCPKGSPMRPANVCDVW